MVKAYAALKAKDKLQLFEYKENTLKDDEVEIDVIYCGICHSDLSMIDNEWGRSTYPLIPGHEVVGKISKKGKSVKILAIGQIVGLGWHCGYCNNCEECNTGNHNLCENVQGTIINHHGGFAQKVQAQEKSVIPIPNGIDLQSAGPLFCGGVTVFTPISEFNLKATDKVAVIGIGGLGHMALKFLNSWGCEVTAFTSSDKKKKEAYDLGAHFIIDSKNKKEIEKALRSFDLIISTVNVNLDWNLYLSTLKPKGRLHFAGVTLEPLNINVFSLLRKQNSISSSPVGSPSTMNKMLNFINLHNIKPKVEVFKMSEVNQAIEHLKSGKANYRIVLENDIK